MIIYTYLNNNLRFDPKPPFGKMNQWQHCSPKIASSSNLDSSSIAEKAHFTGDWLGPVYALKLTF
jgi:hypothetical protein